MTSYVPQVFMDLPFVSCVCKSVQIAVACLVERFYCPDRLDFIFRNSDPVGQGCVCSRACKDQAPCLLHDGQAGSYLAINLPHILMTIIWLGL